MAPNDGEEKTSSASQAEGFLAEFAAAAEFVEAERGKRAEQGKARGQRKQQRQDRVAEHSAGKAEAEYRIDHAENDRVARDFLEILPAEPQRVVQIGQTDPADDGTCGVVLRWLSQRRGIA